MINSEATNIKTKAIYSLLLAKKVRKLTSSLAGKHSWGG